MELTETLISTTPIEHNSFLRIDRDQIRLHRNRITPSEKTLWN